MDLTDDEIKQAIANCEVSAITLDTSIFVRNAYRFEHGLLARLKQFNDTKVHVILSDVVAEEAKTHLTTKYTDTYSKTLAAINSASKAWQFTDVQRNDAINSLFGEGSPRQLAELKLSAFIESSAIGIVESGDRVSVARILNDYFSAAPPFGKSAGKKNEFPDAFALQALEHWAKEKDLQLLVVSQDSDWLGYCKSSPHLVATDDLANALSYFHQNAEVACARLIERFQQNVLPIEDPIQDAVRDAMDRLTFTPEAISSFFYYAEVYDIDVTAISLQNDIKTLKPFKVIDKPQEDLLVVEATIKATVAVSASFDFSVIDPIDKDEIPIGSSSATSDVSMDLRIILSFEGDLAEDAELVEVEVEMGSQSIIVDYGDVAPNSDLDYG